MAKMHAISRLARLLSLKHQRALSTAYLCSELEVTSEKTIDRYIAVLRNEFGWPILYDREADGYVLERTKDGEDAWPIPGLFFSASELTALLTMRQLLATVQPGLFEGEIVPLGQRVEQLLAETGVEASEVAHRIRVIAVGGRAAPEGAFRACADALLTRRRLRLEYRSRGREGDWEERELSPQRLVRYRDTWYLDAYCHSRTDTRVFAVDEMRTVRITDDAAVDVPDAELDELVTSSYGIFTGKATARAVLRFTPRRAQWVSKEEWHPAQEGRLLPDGSYELVLPYVHEHPQELLMDILKYGPDVEVMGPPELREAAAELIERAAGRYRA